MKHSVRKRISIYQQTVTFGEYGEAITKKELISNSIACVYPMASSTIKKEYGLVTNNPKKVIYNTSLPQNKELLIIIDGTQYIILERTEFDNVAILLIDEVKE